MQVATAIANLFNDDDSKQKEIENLQRRIDQLQWELDNADTVRLQNNVGDAVQKLRDIYAETTQEVLRLHLTSQQYGNSWTRMIARMRYISRWGLMRNTQPENIQEHSHMVAVLAHALAVIQNRYFGPQIDPGQAAQMFYNLLLEKNVSVTDTLHRCSR